MSRAVPRMLATLLLVLASFGLVLSPVAACHGGMRDAPSQATPVAAQSSPCHETAQESETPAPDEPAPTKADALACCKAMCAPALPSSPSRVAGVLPADALLHAPRPAALSGLVPPIDKPPPRIRA